MNPVRWLRRRWRLAQIEAEIAGLDRAIELWRHALIRWEGQEEGMALALRRITELQSKATVLELERLDVS